MDHGTYDFRVLLRTGINGTILAQRGPSDDNDLNNENFETRAQDEYVTVIYPNGGEAFTIGQQIQVQWNKSAAVENSFILISRNGGSTFELLAVSQTTSYNWTVTGPASNSCKMEVIGQDAALTFSVYDLSNANFSISDNCSLSQTNNIPNPVSASGGNYNINVVLTGSCTWTLSDNASWITCSPTSGGSGTTQVNVAISANSGNQRTGTITITSSGASGSPININVTQSAASQPCNLTQTNNIPDPVLSNGGSFSSQVTLSGTTCNDWTANSSVGWITLNPSTGGNGLTNMDVEIAQNTGSERTGTITITSTGATGSPISIVVNQNAMICTPGWTPIQNQQYTMNVIGYLNFCGVLSTDTNDVIGAFVGSECRGVAGPTNDGGRLYLSISSNQATGEVITFKAWNSSTCEEFPVSETIVFQDNQIIGTYSDPFDFNACQSLLSFSFNPLYTWFSVNVNPGNMNLGTLFSTPPPNTKIIGQTNFAIWTGSSWQGNLTQIDPKKGYIMYVEQPYNVSILGVPIDPISNPISLGVPWTWIGYLPQIPLSVGTALQNTSPYWVNNESIKNQTQFALFNINNWMGSLTTLYPGSGYKVQVSSPKVLTYPDNNKANTLSETQKLGKQNDSPPNWIPVPNMQYSMNVIAKLSLEPGVFSTNANDLIGAFVVVGADTQCRGVQSPDTTSGLIFLSIGSNSASGEIVYIKAYRSDCDLYKTLSDTFHFQDNRFIGISDPYVFVGDSICVVPVELLSFNADVSGNKVFINWSTATELNNKGFEIEKSFDENNWIRIGFVKGKGTTTEKSYYTFSDNNIISGTNYYRLKQIDFNGSINYSPFISVKIETPNDFSLSQNYPNPFNPTCNINYSLPKESFVTLSIYNILGTKVKELLNEKKIAGNYSIEFNADNLPSGIYFYRLQTENFIETKKMILLK